MPPISYDQFLTASTLALQRGAGASASAVHRDWVKQFIPSTVNKLAEQVAEDPAKRPLLLKEVEVAITRKDNGVWEGAVNTDAYRQILLSALRHASCFDKNAVIEENNQVLELLYKEDWRQVANTARYLNPAYAYYSLRGPTLLARPSAAMGDFSGTLLLHVPAIPDFNTVPLPYELVDDAQMILWDLAGKFLTAKAK